MNWLNQDVVYIIHDDERAAFLKLATDEERQKFIEQFWERRNPPGSQTNKFREEHYRRIAFAMKRYGTASGTAGWRTDRGRMYIVYGPADEMEVHPAGGSKALASEVWLYRHMEGIGDFVTLTFVDRTSRGDFQLAPGKSR